MLRRRFSIASCALFMAAAMLVTGAARAQSAARTLEGRLSVLWADPRPGLPGGAIRFNLTMADGSNVPLSVASVDQLAAIRAFGKRVRIEGHDVGRAAPQKAGAAPIAVDKISVLDADAAPRAAAAVPTTKRVLFILLKYKGDTQTPHTPTFYSALTNPLTPNTTLKIPATINGFFTATSWNNLKWRADIAGVGGLNPTQWLTLPKTKSGYANCGWSSACADVFQLANDAMALARAQGVNVALYDNINFVVNNDLDCCAWGGGFVYQSKLYGVTWEPPWGQDASIYVHEMGHSLGLPHSGWRYHAYDSPWDEMSRGSRAQQVSCGTYRSANSGGALDTLYCSEPGGGYIAPYKDKLAWIPAANKVVVNSISTRTVTLEADSTPLGANPKMIKICLVNRACDGSTAQYLTVEARVKTVAYDKGLPGEGVIVHDFKANRTPVGAGNACFFNTQSGWAMPIDATPGDYRGAPYCDSGGRPYPNYALNNAQYTVGKTYLSSTLGIKIEVLSRVGSTFRVRVTRSK